MKRKYYTLLEFDANLDMWCIAFGDYDWQTVADERDDMRDSGNRSIMRIITTSDKQADIQRTVDKLNIKQ